MRPLTEEEKLTAEAYALVVTRHLAALSDAKFTKALETAVASVNLKEKSVAELKKKTAERKAAEMHAAFAETWRSMFEPAS